MCLVSGRHLTGTGVWRHKLPPKANSQLSHMQSSRQLPSAPQHQPIHSPEKVYGLTLLNYSSLTFSASTSGNFTPRPRSCMESSNVTIAFL